MSVNTYWKGRAQYIFESHFHNKGGHYLLEQLIDRLVGMGNLKPENTIIEHIVSLEQGVKEHPILLS